MRRICVFIFVCFHGMLTCFGNYEEERPKCLSWLKSVSTLNGSSVLLPCTIKGSEPMKIQWTWNNEPLGDRFSVTKDGLYLKEAFGDDAGTYQVSLSNRIGSFTDMVTLRVYSSVKPENYEVADENEEVLLPCGKLDVKQGDGATIMWIKDSRNVLQVHGDRSRININGSLIINPVQRNDLGTYDCVVTIKSKFGEDVVKRTMFLNVRYRPVIINSVDMKQVYVGMTVGLPCGTTGNPGVNLKWLLPNGDPIKASSKFSISANGSLIIRNVGLSDAKNYTCAPSNELGKGEKKHTELVVISPPKFLYPVKKEAIVFERNNIILDCSSGGVPKPFVSWSHEKKKLKNGGRLRMESIGTLTIVNAGAADAGMYNCFVSSIAGNRTRKIKLIVKGKPGTPTLQEVSIKEEVVYARWIPSYNGGSNQTFELWGRTGKEDDFSWKVIKNIVSHKLQLQQFKLSQFGDRDGKKVTYFFSIRAVNEHGVSHFSEVVKIVLSASDSSGGVTGTKNKYIIDEPFPPYNVTVNMTSKGYIITWKEKVVPGRPPATKIIAQYRVKGSKDSKIEWKDFVVPKKAVNKRMRRSTKPAPDPLQGLTIKPEDLNDDNFSNLEFQVVAEAADGGRSEAEKPTYVTTGKPYEKPIVEQDDENEIAPIVLGGIFGVFALVLIVSIYCFCKKRKNRRYSAGKKEQIAYTKENGVRMDSPEGGYSDDQDEADDAKLLSDDQDSPRHYHIQTCPALKLGEYSNNGHSVKGKSKDPVFFLLQRYEEEKEMCTCGNIKYMTLGSHEQNARREKKKAQKLNGNGFYKSNSSPSLLTSENGSSIDPSELLDEEGYDISDNENDAVGELKNGQENKLKRQPFKDSYDQFCRDGQMKDGRRRLSSEEKTEADKNLLESGAIVDMKDLNDVSSENSATESERVITPKMLVDKEDKRRSKSSGYGDGSNSTSDSESIQDLKHPLSGRLPPYTNGYMTDNTMNRRDHGYASDISTRSSPLDYKGHRNRYQPPSQRHAHRIGYDPIQHPYFSEDESVRSSHSGVRPMQPPPYTQALHDIERLSEKNDVTDSEEMYDHLLNMGLQLGVSLDDSIESDLNTKVIMPPPRPYSNPRSFPPPAVESGYLTDNSIGKDRYTDREKSERCAQLLSEFKTSKSRNTVNHDTDNDNYDDELPIEPPTIRSRSVMENALTDSEEPRVPPVLRRSNSAGASGIYKEWLV